MLIIVFQIVIAKSQSGIVYGGGSFYSTGDLNTEKFEFGKFGFDNYALKLTYNSNFCVYSTRDYYFQCDENQEFNFTAPSVSFTDCFVNVYIKTKYPIINSCENNGDIITVSGVFFKKILSEYILKFEGGHILSQSDIISFNSTTLVVNSADYQMQLTSWCDNDFKQLFIDCSNCIGAKLIGLPNNYTIYSHYPISFYTQGIILSGIYLEAPIYSYRRSSALPLPTNFQKVNISGNEIFRFNGNSIVSISGHFIPKIYDNQEYIIGKLEFLNGTICILDYNTLNNSVLTQGIFNIPSGYGNSNFSIYIKDKLVHSNSFTYIPPSKWISSITQNQEKVQLHLSFPFYLFQIKTIKYNDKNGKDLDYTLIEPNIISFTLNSYSTNVISFNDDFHIETLTNGLNFRPIIYSYSIQNGIIIMEGLFVSKLSNYKFYLDDSKDAVSSDKVTYFDRSRLGLVINQFSYVYVYNDDYSFTKVPDLTITSDQDQLLFTCSNCLGGSININEPQSNQDSQFSQIGTIVKQFNTNTIFNKYNIFIFTKDSKALVIQPPLPTNLTIDESLAQLSTFSNNTILVSADFLLDKYNCFDYTDFQLQFDNGTIYSAKKQLLSKSVQNYIYQLNMPFAYGSVDVTVVGSFKTTFKNVITGIFSDTIECHSQIIQQNQNIICQFTMNQNLSLVYYHDAPITIQIKIYIRFSPMVATLFIILSIWFQ
ncbi:hypothetical protein ACTFIR_009916 [Dictyostelium discoideum]